MNSKLLEQKVKYLWKLKIGCEMNDLEQGHVVVRFYDRDDYYHVLEEGPWIVMGHYLTVWRWKPNLRPTDVITSTLAWIKLLEILVELFDKDILLRIGNKVGQSIKIDGTTMQ